MVLLQIPFYILKQNKSISQNEDLKELISMFDNKIKNNGTISTVSDLIEYATRRSVEHRTRVLMALG